MAEKIGRIDNRVPDETLTVEGEVEADAALIQRLPLGIKAVLQFQDEAIEEMQKKADEANQQAERERQDLSATVDSQIRQDIRDFNRRNRRD